MLLVISCDPGTNWRVCCQKRQEKLVDRNLQKVVTWSQSLCQTFVDLRKVFTCWDLENMAAGLEGSGVVFERAHDCGAVHCQGRGVAPRRVLPTASVQLTASSGHAGGNRTHHLENSRSHYDNCWAGWKGGSGTKVL